MADPLHCATATALACANAVVTHKRLGLFISDAVLGDTYLLRQTRLPGLVLQCVITGRTNTSDRVEIAAALVYRQDDGERSAMGGFPVEWVILSILTQDSERAVGEWEHFRCTFTDTEIQVERLDESPL